MTRTCLFSIPAARMLRLACLALALWCGILTGGGGGAPRALAQTPTPVPTKPDALIEAVGTILGDPARTDPNRDATSLITDAVRLARREGRLSPEWSLFFAMLTDSARNDLRNPAYAVQLAEEGLTLIAGRKDYADYNAALQVSRAYALADLGRTREAARAVQLVTPEFRRIFGDDDTNELLGFAAQWSEGQLGALNTDVVTIAEESLDAAIDALHAGRFGEAIARAGAARLTEDAATDPDRRRTINARAEMLTGHAHFSLQRNADAANAYLRGLRHLMAEPWRTDAPVVWADGPAPSAVNRPRAYSMFYNFAHAAMKTGRNDLAAPALQAASGIAETPQERRELMLLQAAVLYAGGDHDAALAGIAASQEAARAAGDAAAVAMADVYTEILMLRTSRQSGEHRAPDTLVNATRAAIALQDVPTRIQTLTRTVEALALARGPGAIGERRDLAAQALDLAIGRFTRTEDTGFGQRAARKPLRETVDAFLGAAHDAAAAETPPERRLGCDREAAVYACTLTRDPG